MSVAASLLTGLGDLVIARRCLHCGEPGVALCADCCGPVEPFVVATGGPATYAAGTYEDGLRAAILAYKERGRRDLAIALAGLLGVAITAALEAQGGPFVLVAVPSVPALARARGGQHVLRLARAASGQLGLPVAPDALRLRRRTRDSAGLGLAARRANLSGAFAAIRPPGGAVSTALVVDDVVTTGATLTEASAALQRAGWSVVGAAVIAATPLRIPRRIIALT